jgi:pilus assembly protein CpaF
MFGKRTGDTPKVIKETKPEKIDLDDDVIEENVSDSNDIDDEEVKEKKVPPKKTTSTDASTMNALNDRFELGDVNNPDGDTAKPDVKNPRIEQARARIWKDLRESLDIKNLAAMDLETARGEITTAVGEITKFRELDLSETEQIQIARECGDDMLGFGPLEPLLERDDIADIMINGPDTTFIEVDGKIEKAEIEFRDNAHLVTIAQRIVGAIGRRVDESSPICDARLPDGSRVNAIIPPLSVDGASMTIRKFKKDKLTLDNLVDFKAITPECAKLLMAIGRSRLVKQPC